MRNQILQHSRILIADDQAANVRLVESMLRKAGFAHFHGTTEPRDVMSLFNEYQPDVVLLDLQMPHIDGFELIKQINDNTPSGTYLPILVLTADISPEAKQRALELGARDFLTKPFDYTEAVLRIHNLLETRLLHHKLQEHNALLEQRVRERTEQLEEAQIEILERLALAAEYRDDNTGQHTQRVGHLAALLGAAAGLPLQQVDLLRQAATLHDIGKIGVPDRILLKPSELTSEEYEHIRAHTIIGGEILSGSRFPVLQMAEQIARYHHERWDGHGYALLLGQEIPLEARIVSIADTFDVLTHERPYKRAWSIQEALGEIERESSRQFDPHLVEVFVRIARAEDLIRLQEALQREHRRGMPLNEHPCSQIPAT